MITTWIREPGHSTLPINRNRKGLSWTLYGNCLRALYTVVIELILAIYSGSNTTNGFCGRFYLSFDSKNLPEWFHVLDNLNLKCLPKSWDWIRLSWAQQGQGAIGFGHKDAHFIFNFNLGSHTANGLWNYILILLLNILCKWKTRSVGLYSTMFLPKRWHWITLSLAE